MGNNGTRIVEDSLMDYLTELVEVFNKSKSGILDKLAWELTNEYIEPYVPQWNPNLYLSGEDSDNWFKQSKDGMTTIEILYTGFTEASEHMYVFYEFGGYSETKMTDLKRDYAYYQEFGKDLFHGKYPEAEKFEGRHFIKQGTEKYQGVVESSISRYMQQVMDLNPVYGVTYQSFYK